MRISSLRSLTLFRRLLAGGERLLSASQRPWPLLLLSLAAAIAVLGLLVWQLLPGLGLRPVPPSLALPHVPAPTMPVTEIERADASTPAMRVGRLPPPPNADRPSPPAENAVLAAIGLLLLWDDFPGAQELAQAQSSALASLSSLNADAHRQLMQALPAALLTEAAALHDAVAAWSREDWQAFAPAHSSEQLDHLQLALLRQPPQLTLQQAAHLLPVALARRFVDHVHLRLRQATAADEAQIRLLLQHGLPDGSAARAAYLHSSPRQEQPYPAAPGPAPSAVDLPESVPAVSPVSPVPHDSVEDTL